MMENAYGIGITNRFSSFLRRASSDSEEDPEEVLKAGEIGAKPKIKSAEKENRTEKVDSVPSQKIGADKPGNNAARKGIRDSNQKGGGTGDAAKSGNRPPPGNEGQKPNRGPRTDRPPYDKERSLKFNDEEREERNNRRNRDEVGSGGVGGPRNDDYGDRRGGRGGYRGERRGGGASRGGGGGGAGGRGGPRKREFDRQSGSDKSGVKSVDKKEGGGSRNWGTYKDEIEPDLSGNQTAGEEPTEEKAEKDPGADDKTDEKNENDASNGPAEPKLMTLEEWKALQQPRQKPVFNLRKAGEGEDQSQWQNLTLKKKEKVTQEEDEYEDEEVLDEYDCPQRAGRQKQVLEIDFHFADSRRGGLGGERRGGGRGRGGGAERGERGGGRGGGGEREGGGGRGGVGGGRGFRGERGGYRGGREDRPQRQAAPRVDDVNDFPSLG